MKALLCKFLRNSPLIWLVIIYYGIFIPLVLVVNGMYIYELCFMLAGIIFYLECSSNEKSRFDRYIMNLPIKRSTYVSYIYVLTAASEVLMYIMLLIVLFIFPDAEYRTSHNSFVPFALLLPMMISLDIAGLAIIINFKFSSTPAGAAFVMFYFVFAFCSGFIKGFTEGDEKLIGILNSNAFILSVSAAALLILIAEWRTTIRVYEKKEV